MHSRINRVVVIEAHTPGAFEDESRECAKTHWSRLGGGKGSGLRSGDLCANYVVRSKIVTRTGEWILRHTFNLEVGELNGEPTTIRSVSFSPTALARLEDLGQKQNSSRSKEEHTKLSGLLDTLGNRLDRTQRGFQLVWMHDSVAAEYQFANGQSESRTFTTARLEQIGSVSRFGTSTRTRFSSKSS